MLSLLYKLDDAFASLEKLLMIVLSGALALLLITQAVLRYGFSAPLFWAEEVALFMLLGVTFFGMSYLLHEDRLINIDFVLVNLKASLRTVVECFNALLGLALLGVLCGLTYAWVATPEVRLEMSATTGLPRWYNYGFLLVALCLMAFHQLVVLFKRIERLWALGRTP
ncbi:TRAP transporter small permease subunit [Pseudomonas sp. NW5]|uniref:TRAP transporter small permease n=1 Tax=Pseudomonas sp. NW5 TaxID=2934934 RepID=UPI0020204120|nr:TRAP transporter small permease subunit [Pseudomonas sp. NW5]MCL7462112.1 TRAP transporter small permease subunit [Pseudomonas sp. NW5]